jgi:hypothetical protein
MPPPAHTCIDRDDGISRDMVVVAALDYRKQSPAILVARRTEKEHADTYVLSFINASSVSQDCQPLYPTKLRFQIVCGR